MIELKQQKEVKLEECRSYKIFKKAVKNQRTLDNYNYSLKEFLRYTNFTNYDEVCQSDKIQEILENWIMDLSDKTIKGNSIRTKLSPVELLLEMNRVVFYKKILHKLIPKDNGIAGGGVPFATEDIKQMLESTKKLRTKALVHFIASTGIRPSAIIDPILRRSHLVEMSNDCLAIRIYDNSPEGYWAFLTPEAKKALHRYFTARKINGETLTDESPIFVNEYDKIDKDGNKIKFSHLTYDNLATIMDDLVQRAGIARSKTGNRYDKAVVYAFRKRFNTILKINNEVNSNIAEKLMAHKNGLDGTYFKPTREECFAEFQKAVFDLTVDDSGRKNLKIEKLEKEKSELEITRTELERMKNETSNTEKAHKVSEDKIKSLEETTRHLTEIIQKQESIKDEIIKIHIKIKETINRESNPSNPHFPDGSPLDTRLVNLEILEINDKSAVIYDSEFGESINVVLRMDKVYCTLDMSTTCKHVLFALGNPDFYSLAKKNNADVLFSITS